MLDSFIAITIIISIIAGMSAASLTAQHPNSIPRRPSVSWVKNFLPSVTYTNIHGRDFTYERRPSLTRMVSQNIGDAPAKTFAELLSGPLVDIYVGATRKHWCLHRNLLCHHSEYFSTELGGDSKKAPPKPSKLELLDDDPLAFEFLVKWLYQGKIDDVSDLPMEQKWDHADTCQKLYILCDRVKMPVLKNMAIDQFRKGCNEAGLVPGPEEMRPVYEKTVANSPFRKLVSKIAARQIMDPESDKDAASYREVFQASPDFAVDVINAIKKDTGGTLFADPTEGDHCSYHEHENGDSCKKRVQFKRIKVPSPKINATTDEAPKVNDKTDRPSKINSHIDESPMVDGMTDETPKTNGITKPSNLKNGILKSEDHKSGLLVREIELPETKNSTNGDSSPPQTGRKSRGRVSSSPVSG